MPSEQSPPPEGLDRASRGLWRRTREALIEQQTWRPVDVATLERYVRAVERGRQARARLEASGQYTALGSNGQLVQHPDVKTAREAERDAQEYAGALLLTPAARSRHNVSVPEPGGPLAAILALNRGEPPEAS